MTTITWIEVKALFDTAPADWSLYVDIFDQHGCENTLQEDRPPSLSSAVVDVAGSGTVVAALTKDLLAAGVAKVETRSLADENWEEHWKQFFHPREIGQRFIIRPTWEEAPPSDRLEIVLDPGQAFGTGDHPTTRMCLELLEQSASPSHPLTDSPAHPLTHSRINPFTLSGKNVADIGCGSGILSIGACLLGAESIHAVDIEPLSVEVALLNAELNNVKIEAVAGRGIAALANHAPFDLVISNIISAVLIQLAPEIAQNLRPRGTWIVSGIIVQNWPDVLEAANRAGFTLEEKLEEDGWVGARLSRA